MLTKNVAEAARIKASGFFEKAGIILTEDEKKSIDVADFGLGELDRTGIEALIYVNTERCCAKELVLFPYQTCPEHRHPPVFGGPGKEETFRCRYGTIYLYIEGEPVKNPKAKVPAGREGHYTVWHEIILQPGDQYTLYPNIRHWFQAGKDGGIVSEFSTKSRSETDIFTDPEIVRVTKVEG